MLVQFVCVLSVSFRHCLETSFSVQAMYPLSWPRNTILFHLYMHSVEYYYLTHLKQQESLFNTMALNQECLVAQCRYFVDSIKVRESLEYTEVQFQEQFIVFPLLSLYLHYRELNHLSEKINNKNLFIYKGRFLVKYQVKLLFLAFERAYMDS